MQPARRLAPLLPPLLFAAYPLLSLFQQNESELPLRVIWTPLLATGLAVAVLYAVLLLVLKSPPKAGAVASLVVLAFFYFETSNVALWIWSLLFLVALVAMVRARRSLTNLTFGLGVAGAVLRGSRSSR